MQPDCFALMLRMTQSSLLALGGYARLCLIVWAMFDSLAFFSIYFISEHELCMYSTMYGKVLHKLLGNCVRPSAFCFVFLKHSLVC